jgi:hypothetical protein
MHGFEVGVSTEHWWGWKFKPNLRPTSSLNKAELGKWKKKASKGMSLYMAELTCLSIGKWRLV